MKRTVTRNVETDTRRIATRLKRIRHGAVWYPGDTAWKDARWKRNARGTTENAKWNENWLDSRVVALGLRR